MESCSSSFPLSLVSLSFFRVCLPPDIEKRSQSPFPPPFFYSPSSNKPIPSPPLFPCPVFFFFTNDLSPATVCLPSFPLFSARSERWTDEDLLPPFSPHFPNLFFSFRALSTREHGLLLSFSSNDANHSLSALFR